MLYTLVFIAIALAVITVCTLRGMKRGIVKPAVRAVFLLISIPVSILVSKLFASLITTTVINSVLSRFSGIAAVASLKDNAAAVASAGKLVQFVVCALVFGLFYILIALLTKLLDPLIVKMFKKYTDIPKRSAIGAVIGGVCGLIITVVLFAPLAGLSATAGSFAQSLPDSTAKTQISAASDNLAFKATRVLGGNLIYHFTTSGKYENEPVSLTKEADVVVKSFAAFSVMKGEMSTWGEEQTSAINAAAESFANSRLIPSIASSVLSDAAAKWSKGEEFSGIKKPEVNSVIQPTLDLIVYKFASCTSETLSVNIKTIAGAFDVLVRNGATEMLSDSESDKLISNILNKFSEGKMTEDLLMCFYDDPQLRVVIPEIYNIGIRALGEKLDIPADKEDLHSRFIQNIVNAVNAHTEEAPDVRAVYLTDDLYDLFSAHGMNCTPVSTMYIAFYLINDFISADSVNAADIEAWFTDYSEAIKEAHADDDKILFTSAKGSGSYTFLSPKVNSVPNTVFISRNVAFNMDWAKLQEKSSVSGLYMAKYKSNNETYEVYTYTDGTLIVIMNENMILKGEAANNTLKSLGIMLAISKAEVRELSIPANVTKVLSLTHYMNLSAEQREAFMKVYSFSSSGSKPSQTVPLPASVPIKPETAIPVCIVQSLQTDNNDDEDDEDEPTPTIRIMGDIKIDLMIEKSASKVGSGSGNVAGCQSSVTIKTNQKTLTDITVNSVVVADHITQEQTKQLSGGITQMAGGVSQAISSEGAGNITSLLSKDTLNAVTSVTNTLNEAQNKSNDNPDTMQKTDDTLTNDLIVAVISAPVVSSTLNLSGNHINDTILAIQTNGNSVITSESGTSASTSPAGPSSPGNPGSPNPNTPENNTSSFSKQYTAAVGSMLDLFNTVMNESSTEQQKLDAVNSMFDNLTPASSGVIASYVKDQKFLTSLKIPAETAPGLSVMLNNLFIQLSTAQDNGMSKEAFNSEADAVRLLLEVVLSARSSNTANPDAPKPTNMFGSNGKLKISAEQLLKDIMKSKIVTYTAMLSFTSYPNAENFSVGKKLNPFALKCFSESDVTEFIAACNKLASEQNSLAVAESSADLWNHSKTAFTRQDYYRRLMAVSAILGINYTPTQDITLTDSTVVSYSINTTSGYYYLNKYTSGKIALIDRTNLSVITSEKAINAKLDQLGYSQYFRISGKMIYMFDPDAYKIPQE